MGVLHAFNTFTAVPLATAITQYHSFSIVLCKPAVTIMITLQLKHISSTEHDSPESNLIDSDNHDGNLDDSELPSKYDYTDDHMYIFNSATN